MRIDLADRGLQDRVKATLRRIAIAGHHLLLHLLVKSVHLVRQREKVPETEGRDTVGESLIAGQREREKDRINSVPELCRKHRHNTSGKTSNRCQPYIH